MQYDSTSHFATEMFLMGEGCQLVLGNIPAISGHRIWVRPLPQQMRHIVHAFFLQG